MWSGSAQTSTAEAHEHNVLWVSPDLHSRGSRAQCALGQPRPPQQRLTSTMCSGSAQTSTVVLRCQQSPLTPGPSGTHTCRSDKQAQKGNPAGGQAGSGDAQAPCAASSRHDIMLGAAAGRQAALHYTARALGSQRALAPHSWLTQATAAGTASHPFLLYQHPDACLHVVHQHRSATELMLLLVLDGSLAEEYGHTFHMHSCQCPGNQAQSASW